MNQYSVEMLDEYIRLQEIVNDHQIRCVITFNSRLNLEQLKSAIIRTIEFVPLISCRYILQNGLPIWEEVPFDIDEALYVDSDSCVEENYLKYFARTPSQNGPQIRFHLIHKEKNDVLIINVNHMIFDGSGFKAYLYLLASLYSDSKLTFTNKSVVRSMDGLLKNIRVRDQLGSLFRKALNSVKTEFFSDDELEIEPRLAQLTINADQVQKINTLCHQNQFTINDFVLALFACSLFSFDSIKKQGYLTVQMMFDLRRYSSQFPVSDFGNFSSMESITLDSPELSLIETAREIGRQSHRIKSNTPGVKNVFLLNTIFKLLPIKRFDSLVAKTIESLGFSTSNLGVIDDHELIFKNCEIEKCEMFTSIKMQPGLQLTFSTYKGSISTSIMGTYSKTNWMLICQILDNMNKLLKEAQF